jgi:hypothetical protein
MRTILRPAALIETWFDTLRADQEELARALRQKIAAAAPELAVSVKWGNLMFTYEGSHAVAIVMHRDHANLQVFNGALLVDRFPELEGTGKGMRHVKLRDPRDADRPAVKRLIRQAFRMGGTDMRGRTA